MPLLTDERTAVAALLKYKQEGGELPPLSYARNVLGAHYNQAKRIVGFHELVDAGTISLEDIPVPEDDPQPEEVRVEVETGDGTVDISLYAGKLPILSYEDLVKFYNIDTDVWEPTSQGFSFWGSEKNPNFKVSASFQKRPYLEALKHDREGFKEWAKSYAPRTFHELEPIKTRVKHGRMLEIMVPDLHAEKLVHGAETDVPGVMQSLRTTVSHLMKETGQGHLQHIVLVFNGDTLNADNMHGTTTKGTPQENTGDWFYAFNQVRKGIADLAIELAASNECRVSILLMPGNHDYERTHYLQDSLDAFFTNTDLINVMPMEDRHYVAFGVNLIGFTHGDRVKPADLAMAMFREHPTNGDGYRFLEWHMGHVHTQREHEDHGVLFRWFRTPRAPNRWEIRHGYGHNLRTITGIVWDEVHGPVATVRVPFQEVVDE